ncbi:DUF192 domain-containing protein [Patescibacteria group bacterium]|nr:MAG: DUF192 domain-containing protein [Patescibacteria group bacterium]
MFFKKRENKQIKKWEWIMLLVILGFSIFGKIYYSRWPTAVVKIGGREVSVLVADNELHRFKGWSKRDDMGKYGGMLFVFPERGQHAMVMRDMRFPLDIIWIDGTKIVDIAPNLQPDPANTEAGLTPYFARLPSTLVLELSSGFTQKNGVKIGDTISISSPY